MSLSRTALLFLFFSSATACVAPGSASESEAGHASLSTDAPENEFSYSPFEQVVTLTLETREGTGEMGWSFALDGLVPSDEADLSVFSWDCGSRGRWVDLVGPVEFCFEGDEGELDPDSCAQGTLEIGGSNAPVALGERFWVVTDQDLHPVTLLDRTPTPANWSLEEDLSFDVVLELRDTLDHGR